MLEILKAILLGIVQGITEWLPISSTGHMILVNEFINLNFSKEFVDTFLVVVQLGSIIAVIVLYFHKLNPFSSRKNEQEKKDTIILWSKVLIASIPAGIVGVLFSDMIREIFYAPIPIAIALIIYGALFIALESQKRKPKIKEVDDITYPVALFMGMFQMLALIPGTSRSGSTILGATIIGCSRVCASEFSFFMAIPVMLGASLLDLLKVGFSFSGIEWIVLLTGSLVAFIVSVFAIKFLLNYIRKHGFTAFGYYRIILGILVIIYFSLVG